MDELDNVILAEMTWRPADARHAARGFQRPWDVARVLGTHGTTVKRRLADLREQGALKGVYLLPAPALVARGGSAYIFSYRDCHSKRAAYDALRADPDVWECYGLVGTDIVTLLYPREGEDERALVDRLASVSGAIDARYHHETGWKVPTERISALDLRILAAFAEDAFRPIAEAAAEVGISAKTTTTRLRTLTAARAFSVHPHLDPSRLGGILAYLDVELTPEATEGVHSELANRFPSAPCRSTRGTDHAYVVAYAAGARELESMLKSAEGVEGVARVRGQIIHDIHKEPTHWRDALLERAEELAREKGIWSPSWRARPAIGMAH